MQRSSSSLRKLPGLFTKSDIEITGLRSGDMDKIAALTKKVWEEMYAICEDNAFTQAHIDKLKNTKNAVFGVARVNGEIAGFYKMIISDHRCELLKLYLNTDFQRRGIGSLLMQDCMQQAVEHGKNYMTLEVWSENPDAITFYQKHGFEIKDIHRYTSPDGSLGTDINNLMRCDDLSAQLNLNRTAISQRKIG